MILQVFQQLQKNNYRKLRVRPIPLFWAELDFATRSDLSKGYSLHDRDLEKVTDYLFQTEEWTMWVDSFRKSLYFLQCGLCGSSWQRSHGAREYYKVVGIETFLILALNCYQHWWKSVPLRMRTIWGLCGEVSGNGIKLYGQYPPLSQSFALYQRLEEGCSQMQESYYFWCAWTSKQVTTIRNIMKNFVNVNFPK